MIYGIDQVLAQYMDARRLPRDWESLPYVSPTEERMVEAMRQAGPAAEWRTQLRVKTGVVDFFLDVAAKDQAGRYLAFECDGGRWHKDPLRDFCRDALILGRFKFAAVWRLRACDVQHRLPFCLCVIGGKEPGLLDPGKLRTLEGLAGGFLEVRGAVGSVNAVLGRRCRADGNVQAFLEFAARHRGVGFKGLVERYRAEGGRP